MFVRVFLGARSTYGLSEESVEGDIDVLKLTVLTIKRVSLL